MTNKISFFTPIMEVDNYCTSPAAYFSPFGGVVALPVTGTIENGSVACASGELRREWWETALIILSYVLSVGIAPLIALLANLYYRCKNEYHWVDQTMMEEGKQAFLERARQNPTIQTEVVSQN